MTLTNFQAFRIPGYEGTGNTIVFHVANETIRILQTKRQPDHRGNRRQRDITFFEIKTHTQDFLALPLALADNTGIRQGGSIGTGQGPGKGETGYFFPFRQSRQVVVLLFFSTILHQQFTGTK